MKVFITGSSGWIGRRVLDFLPAECETLLLSRLSSRNFIPFQPSLLPASSRSLLVGDLFEPKKYRSALLSFAPDIVLHLAGYTYPSNYLHDPVQERLAEATAQLGEILLETPCERVVAMGTSLECLVRTNVSVYARQKIEAEKNLRRLIGKRLVWTRPFQVYGPGEHPDRFLPRTLSALHHEAPLRRPTHDQARDWVHVDDVARAIVHLMGAPSPPPIVEIGTGHGITTAEWIREVEGLARATNRPCAWGELLPARLGEPPVLIADPKELEATGFACTYSFAEGLLDTWQKSAYAKP